MIDLVLSYYTWLLEMIPMLTVFAVSIFFHELGHYYIAKKEKNYKGWGLIPHPHIKLKSPGSRFGYLAGFLFSMIVLPFWVVAFGLQTFWVYIILQMGAAGADFFVFIFYGYFIKKKHQEKENESSKND